MDQMEYDVNGLVQILSVENNIKIDLRAYFIGGISFNFAWYSFSNKNSIHISMY